MVITEGRENDVSVAKKDIPIEPDSIYCFDRGYVDFGYFRRLHEMGCTFVTRVKKNLVYKITGQQECLKNRGVLMDATIVRGRGEYEGKDCPLRVIRYYDKENDRTLEFLTNNTTFAATTIAAIYKARWQIEAFFKWIKQNLKVKTFLGTTENAVLSQIWVAMIYYLLLAYIKYQTKYGRSLFYLHRLIKETLLDRITLVDLLNLNEPRLKRLKRLDPQLQFSFIST
jgi:IS4 transposase